MMMTMIFADKQWYIFTKPWLGDFSFFVRKSEITHTCMNEDEYSMAIQLPICRYEINRCKVKKRKKKSRRNRLERMVTRERVGICITTLTLDCVCIRTDDWWKNWTENLIKIFLVRRKMKKRKRHVRVHVGIQVSFEHDCLFVVSFVFAPVFEHHFSHYYHEQ